MLASYLLPGGFGIVMRPQLTSPFRSPLITPLIAVVLFVVAMWQYSPGVHERAFHRDEARWIHRAVYLRELRHPLGPYWQESTWQDGDSMDAINRLRAQPPVGSYVIGLGMLLQGVALPDIGYWNMDHDEAWNTAAGNMPSDEQLTAARRTTATMAALAVVLVYLIGLRLTSQIGAVAGALVLALHPLAIYLSTFAGADATLVFFIALATWLGARLMERPTWPQAIAFGIAIGLGGGTKLSPLGIAVIVGALGVIGLLRHWRDSDRKLGWMLVSVPAVAAITFVGSYPYLWRNPIGNSLNLLRYRTLSMDLQGTLWQQVAIDSPFAAMQRIWQRFGSADWSLLGRWFGWSVPVENLLSLAGAGILLWLVWRRGLFSATGIIAIVLGSSTVITIAGMQVDWARYHYPILLAMAVCIGITAGFAANMVTSRLAGRREQTS